MQWVFGFDAVSTWYSSVPDEQSKYFIRHITCYRKPYKNEQFTVYGGAHREPKIDMDQAPIILF